MSDMGPLVAAHLRDKVIADLLEENQRLKSKMLKARRIAITGPNGSPIYAEEDFGNGLHNNPEEQSTSSSAGGWWQISLSNSSSFTTSSTKQQEDGDSSSSNTNTPTRQLDTCTLSNLPQCEVRIGVFLKIKIEDIEDLVIEKYDRELSMVKIRYCCIDHGLEVTVCIPMSEQIFLGLHSRTQRLHNGSSLFMDLIPTDEDVPVRFEQILFYGDTARDALQDLGIESAAEWLGRNDDGDHRFTSSNQPNEGSNATTDENSATVAVRTYNGQKHSSSRSSSSSSPPEPS